MCKTKYRIIKDKDGVRDYNHHDEWKKVFQPKKDRDYLMIGDMPEWYNLLKKYINEDKKKKKP